MRNKADTRPAVGWDVVFMVVASLGLCVVIQAQGIDEKTRQELRELKTLCDEGVIRPEVCKEKQREILGLSPQTSGPSSAGSPEYRSENISIAPGTEASPVVSRSGMEKSTRGFLGVSVRPVPPDLAEKFGLNPAAGALVTRVIVGTPAERAGIERDDILMEFDNTPIRDAKAFSKIEADTPAGKQVPIKVLRAGKESTLNATMVDRKAFPPARMYKSPMGFTVHLPSGWVILNQQEIKDGFEKTTRRMSDDHDHNIEPFLEFAKKNVLSKILEFYFKEGDYIHIKKHKGAVPGNSPESSKTCQLLSSHMSRVAKRSITTYDCRLRIVAGFAAFYMNHDAIADGMRTIQFWIKKGTDETIQFILNCKKENMDVRIQEFENIMASVRWI